jgi:hypothetical protein
VSGYRVLAVVLALDGREVPLQLPADDPTTWDLGDPATVEIGRAGFSEISRDDGPVCARCHTDSGSDLQYFGFSNASIVARSIFHLFPHDEAEAIAAYLRHVEVSPQGRIFEPPFQPGDGNHGAAGSGHTTVVDDETFGSSVFGEAGLPDTVAWDWPQQADIDLYTLPAPVQLPAWFQWLPRDVDEAWFEVELDDAGSTLGAAEQALLDEPTVENAQRFMSLAIEVGARLIAGGDPELGSGSDHYARIQLLRLVAVKLWEWSRRQDDFESTDHGFPQGTPAYPYEVGFTFFEAAQAEAVPDAWIQTMQWWWAQLVVDAGRGHSNGRRPLNYRDVLIAAESAGLGPNTLVFLHLYGSWEESRGELADQFGEEVGPARLLAVPLRNVDARTQEMLWRRFLVREAQWLADGGTLSQAHHDELSAAWSDNCDTLSPEQRDTLRALVDDPTVTADLAACP